METVVFGILLTCVMRTLISVSRFSNLRKCRAPIELSMQKFPSLSQHRFSPYAPVNYSGNWTCLSCGNENYASRTHWYRSGTALRLCFLYTIWLCEVICVHVVTCTSVKNLVLVLKISLSLLVQSKKVSRHLYIGLIDSLGCA